MTHTQVLLLAAAGHSDFADAELAEIDRDAVEAGINLWSVSDTL